ncbi:MAG TPA: CHAP domain-containing protein [Candidatus Saccharimonadales bacterium]|nr:CHAP domain-containing protein [Candidatus Saccharimonadales bacterium]
MRAIAGRFFANRRVVRYSIISLNVLLLVAIGGSVIRGTQKGQPVGQNAVLSSTGRENSAVPLDQVSSADIAANAALAAGLAETPGVINQAQSAQADLITSPADTTAVAKPQAVATALKSRKDIRQYVTQSGDTVSGLAAKFNVTSESIRWSNNLSGNTVNAGVTLQVPPVNGIVYTVQAGDTLDSLASKYRANRDQLVAYNDAELSGIQTGEQILIPNGQLPAPVVTRVVASAVYAGGAYNGYDYGFCTWYVANRRAAAGRPVPSNLGNANTWTVLAASMGIATGSTPQAGAVAVKHSGAPGHVAYVEQVNDDGSFWISEMNSYGQVSMGDSTPRGGWGVIDWKLIPADEAGTYSYVY